ncbi:MAG: hypothetical protein MRY76_05675, partial [Pseudomonadales bacterium]|nr:hypothetical protein [Pseudomonadales bacterium]
MVETYWNQCIECLKDELPSQQFNTWIRPLQIEAEADVLRVYAPNRFIKDWVKGKFLNRIEALLSELGADSFSIELKVKGQIQTLDSKALQHNGAA